MAFLLPAIPWLIGLAFAGGAVLVLNELLNEKTAKKTLAIIGDSKSGKTTFTRLLLQGIVGASDYERTIVSKTYKGTQIQLENGTTVHVGPLKDLPGEKSAWKEWKERVADSDYVLYLLRSRTLRTGAGGARDRCRRDLQQLKYWIESLEKDSRPPVILIFNFRDKDPSSTQNTADYGKEILEIAQLKEAVMAIGLLTRVSYASGSMVSEEEATKLLKEVGNAL